MVQAGRSNNGLILFASRPSLVLKSLTKPTFAAQTRVVRTRLTLMMRQREILTAPSSIRSSRDLA